MIHQYKLNDYNIVLDTSSGSVHVMDDVAFDIVSLYPEHSSEEITSRIMMEHGHKDGVDTEEIRACLRDVEELASAGRLFSEDPFGDLAGQAAEEEPVLKALCLHVAHTCNLDCSYCFAAQGRYHGERALMSFEVGKQAIDYLVARSGSRVNLEVDFFGGEPLMNWDVCKQIVAYARSLEKEKGKRFRFTLTTNGMLIDEDVIEFSNREMHNVVLSLDGRKDIHDALRKTADGKGSYDRIIPKFRQLVEARGDREYYMRGTFTHRNPDFTEDLFHMAELGFSALSMEPVVCSPEDPAALTEADLPVLFEQYEILAKEMLVREKAGKPIVFYHYMLDLTGGPCIHKRISGCGSGTEYLAVTPTGELYPCHQFVGEDAFRMGDVWTGITAPSVQKDFRQCNAYARPECRDCWAQLYCSGGCAANAYHATGSVLGVYDYGCRLFKKRLECAIMLQIARSLASDPDTVL